MYMVPLMFMGMFMHVHACSCMLNSGCPFSTKLFFSLPWSLTDVRLEKTVDTPFSPDDLKS